MTKIQLFCATMAWFASLVLSAQNSFFSGDASPEAKCDSALTISGNYLFIQADSALHYAKLAQHFAAKANYTNGLMRSANHVASAYMAVSDYPKSVVHYKAYLQLAEKIGSSPDIGHAHNNIGLVYFEMGLYELAAESFKEAIEKRQKVGDESAVFASKYNMGNLMRLGLKNKQDALRYLRQTQMYFEKHNDRFALAKIYNALAYVYLEESIRLDSAAYFFDKAMGVIENDLPILFDIHSGKGTLALSKQKFNEAEKEFVQALLVSKELNSKRIIALCHENLADLFVENRSFIPSKLHLDTAKNIYQALDLKDGYSRCLLIESDWYDAQNQKTKALELLKEATALKDSVLSADISRKLTWLRIITEEDRLLNDNVLLANDRDLQTARAEREKANRNLLLASAAILIFVVLIMVMRYREKVNTNRKLELLNNQLQKSEDALRASNLSKDVFFGIIGHDLRNPLMAFERLSEKLSQENIAENKELFKNLASSMHKQASVLSTLLNNLLIWSKNEQGLIVPKPKAVLLHDVAQDAIALHTLQAKEKNVDIVNKVPEEILVFIDKDVMYAVLRNLVNNAVKFTDRGSITIGATHMDGQVLLVVKDTGRGIEPTKLEKIFSLEGKTQSGLGLILCRDLLEKCNATIKVESKVSIGTIVTLSILPFKSEE